jgi:Tfp pilus assembly protein PilV
MSLRLREGGGFTLLEVTFATGILFLTLVLLLGALSHIALLRELGERRHLAALCLSHCLEQLQSTPPATMDAIQINAPESLPGTYTITVTPATDVGPEPAVRINVSTQSTRGHHVEASALYVLTGVSHAP